MYVPGACIPQLIEKLELAVKCAALTDDVKLEKSTEPLIEESEDFGDEDFDALFADEVLDADELEEIAVNFLMLNTHDTYRVDKTEGYSFKKFTFKEAPTATPACCSDQVHEYAPLCQHEPQERREGASVVHRARLGA